MGFIGFFVKLIFIVSDRHVESHALCRLDD